MLPIDSRILNLQQKYALKCFQIHRLEYKLAFLLTKKDPPDNISGILENTAREFYKENKIEKR